MKPQYSLRDIKFGSDSASFKKAIELYEKGKVTAFKKETFLFKAVILGTKPYHVWISATDYDKGDCDCYLGQNDTLCKHMLALAIMAIMNGKPLTDNDKEFHDVPTASGKIGTLSTTELANVKAEMSTALRYIKAYSGSSRTWFDYQNKLDTGTRMLSAIISELPASKQTAKLILTVLLKLDKKLSHGGVDDSDGIVGGFIENGVAVLKKYVKLDPTIHTEFEKLRGAKTCFGWEEQLLK